MFILEIKYEDGSYGIRDTDDNSLDKCSRSEIKTFIKQGLSIQGVTVSDGKIYLHPVKEDGFKGTAIRTVKSASAGNDMSVFSQAQRQVIENYYIWQTVSLYKSLAKSIRLGVKESKVIELTKLRGNITWEFGGIIDTGYFGGGTCALGHSLRYEYIAVGIDEATGQQDQLIFGETCAGDFLDISKEDLSKLIKVRKSMNEEIAHMIECMKDSSLAMSDMKSFVNLVAYLKDIASAKFNSKVLNNFLAYFNSFMKVGIPFPSSLVKAFTRYLETDKLYLSIGSKLYAYEVSFLKKYDIFDEKEKVYQNWYTRKVIENNLEHLLATYLWFFFTNSIEGCYAYDPIAEVCKSEGGFSKRAKLERRELLDMFKKCLGCTEFSYVEMKGVIGACFSLIDLGKKLYKECGKDFATYDDISLDSVLSELSIPDFYKVVIDCANTTTKVMTNPNKYSAGYTKRNFDRMLSALEDGNTYLQLFDTLSSMYQSSVSSDLISTIRGTQLNLIEKLTKEQDKFDKEKLSLDEILKIDIYNYYTRREVKEACKTLAKVDKSSELGKYILSNNPILLSVPETVLKREGCSQKQLKLIKWAYDLYNEFISANDDLPSAEDGEDNNVDIPNSDTEEVEEEPLFNPRKPSHDSNGSIPDSEFIF